MCLVGRVDRSLALRRLALGSRNAHVTARVIAQGRRRRRYGSCYDYVAGHDSGQWELRSRTIEKQQRAQAQVQCVLMINDRILLLFCTNYNDNETRTLEITRSTHKRKFKIITQHPKSAITRSVAVIVPRPKRRRRLPRSTIIINLYYFVLLCWTTYASRLFVRSSYALFQKH